jgi:parvulin-like peptidyl-prolyl isomerase
MVHLSRRRSIASALLAMACLVLAVSACGDGDPPAGASASPPADAVVATVDGSAVHASEVQLVRAERRLLGEEDGAAAALDEAVERTLMRREADRLGAEVDQDEVRRRLTELDEKYGGEAAVDAALRAAGMDRAQLRQSVADGVLREALRDAKYVGAQVTPQAVSDYYRQNRASLFTRPAAVRLSAIQVRTRQVAENVIGQLDEGRPFAEVARQFSVDPQSRDAGGDLGWVLTSSLPSVARKAVLRAGSGVIGRPVGEGNVWYVLNVRDRRDARVVPFAEVRTELATQLTDVKRSKALERWLDAARERAAITIP